MNNIDLATLNHLKTRLIEIVNSSQPILQKCLELQNWVKETRTQLKKIYPNDFYTKSSFLYDNPMTEQNWSGEHQINKVNIQRVIGEMEKIISEASPSKEQSKVTTGDISNSFNGTFQNMNQSPIIAGNNNQIHTHYHITDSYNSTSTIFNEVAKKLKECNVPDEKISELRLITEEEKIDISNKEAVKSNSRIKEWFGNIAMLASSKTIDFALENLPKINALLFG